jgi:hypothetical protein
MTSLCRRVQTILEWIGAAVDAQRFYTGRAKLAWDVYAGEEFVFVSDLPGGWTAKAIDFAEVQTCCKVGGSLPGYGGAAKSVPGHRAIALSWLRRLIVRQHTG